MAKAILVPQRARLPDSKEYYRPSIEYTGKGNILCYDGYGGRWFRSSVEAVQEAVDHFIEEYEKGYVLSYNDLYLLLGMAESDFGEQYGYSPSEDWKVDLAFIIDFASKNEMMKLKMKTKVLVQNIKY